MWSSETSGIVLWLRESSQSCRLVTSPVFHFSSPAMLVTLLPQTELPGAPPRIFRGGTASFVASKDRYGRTDKANEGEQTRMCPITCRFPALLVLGLGLSLSRLHPLRCRVRRTSVRARDWRGRQASRGARGRGVRLDAVGDLLPEERCTAWAPSGCATTIGSVAWPSLPTASSPRRSTPTQAGARSIPSGCGI